jgi:hypothetical protein
VPFLATFLATKLHYARTDLVRFSIEPIRLGSVFIKEARLSYTRRLLSGLLTCRGWLSALPVDRSRQGRHSTHRRPSCQGNMTCLTQCFTGFFPQVLQPSPPRKDASVSLEPIPPGSPKTASPKNGAFLLIKGNSGVFDHSVLIRMVTNAKGRWP